MDKSKPEWKAWQNMQRRGIPVCDRWVRSFQDFLQDVGPRPDGPPRYWRLDRIDKSKGYEPSNVEWATASDTRRRSSVKLVYGSRHHFAKMTEDDIRFLRAANLTRKELQFRAAQMGVAYKTLRHAVQGKTWKHVT